jgi:uncharacterized protein (DUF983 family)
MSLRDEIYEALVRLEHALRADPKLAALIRSPGACPRCGRGRISTSLPDRTHRCRECGHTWTFSEDIDT